MSLTAPKSQKAEDRPISFILDARGAATEEVTLFIRPEELTRTHQSRTSVNQTLGGAWIDSTGEGLETSNLSGTLGWRTDPGGLDGGDRMIDMRKKTFHRWHQLRQAAVDRGEDPNDVSLRFVDALNDYSSVIVPLSFEIRRSKSQPLLAKYRISFISIGLSASAGAISAKQTALGAALGSITRNQQRLGLDSLLGSLKEINAAINDARNFVDKTILRPVQDFMRLSTQVFNAVHNTIENGLSLADPFINVANGIAQTGVNIFRTMASVVGIPAAVKARLMNVAGAYSNAFCVLKNALRKTSTYEDYNQLYGASNCSSTGGGLPPSQYGDQNPFFAVAETTSSRVGVSVGASAAISDLARRDIVIDPPSISMIGATLADIQSGVFIQ